MQAVSVSDLKAHLSKYLRDVRRGGEVQILDRGVPVARLIGVTPGPPDDEYRQRLIGSGVLRAGGGDLGSVLKESPIELPVSIVEALDEDRADRL